MNETSIEVAQKLKAEALKIDAKIREASVSLNKRSMEIGWLGFQMKQKNLFGILGFDSEESYADSVGICRSTWFRNRRIAESLQTLPKEEFLSISLDNADILSRLPQDERTKPEWIEKATTLTKDKLSKEVVITRAERENLPVEDVRVSLKISCYEGQREHVMEFLERWKQEHGLKDTGHALELVIAEIDQRDTFVEFFSNEMPRLRQAVALTKDGNLSAEEVVEKLKTSLEDHILGMKTLVEAILGKKKQAA